MTGGDRLLSDDEVEFLLQQAKEAEQAASPDPAGAPAPADAAAGREITMRGDLEKINLSDIFQTLALSKMEGLLRVTSPLEQRDIHFQDGYIRCFVPRRVEALRLGQRLIRAGLISGDQLRSALLEQKRLKKPLGETMVAQGYVTEADIDDVVANQVQEDLFALFTWAQGTFEFYKGSITDAHLLDQLDKAPRFDVNGVLLEVARRSDEWQRIIAAVRSLDEVFVVRDASAILKPNDSTATVIEACKKLHTLRELADVTLLGLFECSRTVRELLECGALRRVTFEEGLEAAEQQLGAGEPKRAAMTIKAILERGEHRLRAVSEKVAEILSRCGESKLAGRVLIDAAELEADDGASLDLARRARELSPRSLEVLSYLQNVLQRVHAIDPKERFAVTSELVDELFERGELDDALGLVEQLETESNDLVTCRPKRARILARLGRSDEAVEALLGLAQAIQEDDGDKDKLGTIYEQILKIDYRRKDVARSLKNLHASSLARRVRRTIQVTVALALGLVGWTQVDAYLASQRIGEIQREVQSLASANRIDEASRAVQAALIEFDGSTEIVALQQYVERARKRQSDAQQRDLETARLALLRTAVSQIEAGDVAAGLDTFFGQSNLGAQVDTLERDLKGRFKTLVRPLVQLSRAMPERIPPEPSILQKRTEQEALLAALETELATPQRRLVAGLLAVKDDPRVVNALGRDREALYSPLEKLAELFTRGDALAKQYQDRVSRHRVAEELTPIYEEAVRHERARDFEAAMKAYRTLAENHPAEDDLRQHFRTQVERYSAILRLLAVIREATERGDFAAAQGQLRALRQQYQDIKFDEIVDLPVRIRTTPPGARVYVAERFVGTSPMLTAYRPGVTTPVRIELDGFFDEATELGGDEVGLVQSLLVRKPSWSHPGIGTVDRQMAGAAGGLVLITDRAGSVRCVRASDGDEQWRLDTGDLSGLLSRPVVHGDRVLVASIDGELRCLALSTGDLIWKVDGVESSAAPVVAPTEDGPRVVVAGQDGRMAAYELATGAPSWEREFRLTFEADLVCIDGVVVAASSDEVALGVAPRTGEPNWRTAISRGVVLPPAVAGSRVALVGDDGSILMLDGRAGTVRWKIDALDGATSAPVIHGERLFVADGRTLETYSLRDGKTGPTRSFPTELRMHLAQDQSTVFVGDDQGIVYAIDPSDLSDRYLLRGASMAVAPVLPLPDGTLVLTFQDQSVHGYLGTR